MSIQGDYWEWRFHAERAKKRFAVAVCAAIVLAWAFTAVRLAKARIDRRLDEATRTGVIQ